MEIWDPKPPGTLWTTPGLLRESFPFVISETVLGNTVHIRRTELVYLFSDAKTILDVVRASLRDSLND